MPETPNFLETRIKQLEDELGIAGISSPVTKPVACPVGMVIISTTSTCPYSYGTWVLMDSGNLLGGQAGTVYAWKRTA